jgi:hypothetical protein
VVGKIAANVLRLCDGRQSRNLIINRDVSGGYCKTAVSRWPFSTTQIKMKWIDFKNEMPKEGQRVIIAENGYGAFDTYFEFDKDADYSNCKWCLWPF